MAAQALLHEDPRYPAFRERFYPDCARFAVEALGEDPTWQQFMLYDAISEQGARVSVSSGRGTGKTRGIGVIVVWCLLCYFDEEDNGNEIVLTAPKADHVRKQIWKEIAIVLGKLKKGPYAWIRDFIELKARLLFIKGYKESWFVHAKTAPRGHAEGVSGSHSSWMLIIADEASGIEDGVLTAFINSCTDRHNRNRMLMTSQGSRLSGVFYDACHRNSTLNGGTWEYMRFDSSKSDIVSPEKVREWEVEYGGVDTDLYRVNVGGYFPLESDKYLIGRQQLERCYLGGKIIAASQGPGWIIAFDVGGGGYRDKSAIVIARVVGYGDFGPDARRVEIVRIIADNSTDPVAMGRKVMSLAQEYNNATVIVDGMGIGAQSVILIREVIANVIDLKWGKPCWVQKNKDLFANQRAQANESAARAAKQGRLKILTPAHREDLLGEGSRVPVTIDHRGRRLMMSKERMLKEGIHSPDVWDAVAFLFVERSYFMPSGEGIETEGADPAGNWDWMKQFEQNQGETPSIEHQKAA